MHKESRFRELIRRQESSGLSTREFCFNEGIAPSTFYYWRKKLQGVDISKNNFIPLHLGTPGSSITEIHSQGYNQRRHVEGNALLELVYPNGTLLRINEDLDLAHLRALIHLYD